MARRWVRWLAAATAALLPGLGLWPQAAHSERGPLRAASAVVDPEADTDDDGQARVIVKYRSGSTLATAGAGRPQHAARLGRQLSLSLRDGRVLGPRTQALRASGLGARALAARLAAQADVEWAVPVRRKTVQAVVPTDPYYASNQTSITPAVGQWYLRTPDATAVAAVNAEAAWAVSTGSAGVTVAVLDTGVRFDHPDLAGKLHPGYDFISRSSTAVDGGNRDNDASDPGDYTDARSCSAGTSSACSSWHGTQVAGLVGAASDNGVGMAGLGRGLMLLPVRVIGKGGGYDDDIIAGMRWAAGLANASGCTSASTRSETCNPHPVQVLNLSLGATGSCSTAYQDAVTEIVAAGVVVVVAAGNDTGHAVNEPANCEGALAVAGVRHAGTKVGYSNVGPQVAIAAPAGNCVNLRGSCLYPLLTTTNLGSTTPDSNGYSNGGSRTSLGTSFAAPLVSGTVGLMLSARPGLTPAQVRSALQATARAFPTVGAQTANAPTCTAPTGLDQLECYCTTSTCGAGLLDAGAAVARAAAVSTLPVAAFVPSSDTPTVGTTVTLDAGGSSAGVVSYQWSLSAGTGLAGFTGATNARTATLRVTGTGSVEVTLTVTDGAGQSSSAARTLAVTASPTAAIAASTSAPTAGATVTLDGSGSVAGTGRSIVGYQWALTEGSSLATLSSTTGAATTLRTTEAGTVEVQLTVTDNLGATGSVTQTLQVGVAPQAAVSPGAATVTAGRTLALDGGGSTAASGHRLVGYQWSIVDGGTLAAFSGATNTSTATLSATAAGSVTVRLVVTDDAGVSSSAQAVVTVAAEPVVVSGAAGGGGGALGWGWAAGLALALGLLRRRPR